MSNTITSISNRTDKHLIHTREGFTGAKFSKQHLIEGVGENSGKFYLKGILQRADSTNQNGRVYPYQILNREVKKYIATYIAEKRAYGELDHPSSSVVELKTASHTIEKLWWQGKDLYGLLEILPTPNGNIVKNIVQAGKTVGISSRGLGSYHEVGENVLQIQEDFELIGWDIVSNPSTHQAFVYPTNLNEGNSKVTKANKLLERAYTEVDNTISDIISTF